MQDLIWELIYLDEPFEVPFELGEEILGGKGGGCCCCCWCDGFHPAGEALDGGETQFLKRDRAEYIVISQIENFIYNL